MSDGLILEVFNFPAISMYDIFSTTPNKGVLTLLNISAPFLTSVNAMSFGVVTMIAPSRGIFCDSVNCTSPVPGGRSRIRKSSSPQITSLKNCSVIFATRGPLQTTGA